MKSSEFSVEIIDIALPNNYGVAKKDGLVIFIPGAVIGDKVTVKIGRENKRFAYGEITHIDVPSPYRTSPACPHFGSCGGCSLQQLQYNKQLEIKQRYLLENLSRIGGIHLESIETFQVKPSPELYFYRNKLELSFSEKNKEVVLGLRERMSPFKSYTARVIPLNKCPVFSPVVEKIAPIIGKFAHIEGFTAFNPLTKKGVLKHLVLRESKATGEIMVILETRSEALQGIENVIDEMKHQVPEVASVYHATNRKTNDIVHFERINRLFGTRSIIERISGLNLKVYPGTFLQPNSKGSALLYGEIAAQLNLKGNETILGLYCGTGPIEIFLSNKAQQIIGVDSEPVNITTANENCKINQIKNCNFYLTRAEDILKRISPQKADILIIDPPRTGLSKQGLSAIKKLSISKLAYVSCNPATLARDLRELCGHGYTIHRIIPFDFFPHTGHLETLAILER
jgi:23S rRNA (uracil1939-C5)-methyltransferase